MTGPWQTVSEYLAHALLAGGGVLLVGWLLGRLTAAPARRRFVAAWTMRGAVVAAGLSLLPSWITIPRWVRDAAPVAVVEPVVLAETPLELVDADDWAFDFIDPSAVSVDVPAEPVPAASPSITLPAEESSVQWPSVIPWLVGAYAVVATALLAQLVLGHVVLWRLRRMASPAPSRCQEAADTLVRESAGPKPPTVVVSDRIDTPVCFGVARPTVVLPRRLAADASADELRWVLAHEFDHLRRGDPATAVWAGVARGLFFGWPMFWAVRRDLTLSQEFLADAAAAAAGGLPADYAAFLVDLSDPAEPRRRPLGFPSLLAAHAVRAGRSDLFRRVNMVLSSGVSRRVPAGWAAMAACGVLSAAVGFSGLGWAAADDDKPKPEAAKKAVPRDDDRKPDAPRPPKPPTPPRPDGERRDDDRRDGDRREGERRDGDRRDGPPDIGKIERQLEDAIKDGRSDEAMKLVNQLKRAMMAGRGGAMGGVMGFSGGMPGMPGQGGQFRIELPGGQWETQSLERALKALQQQADNQKDNPQVQEALRKVVEKMRADLDLSRAAAERKWEAVEKMRADMDKKRETGEKAQAEAEKAGKGVREYYFAPGGSGGVLFGGEGGPNRMYIRPMTGRLGVAVGRVPEAVYEQIELPKGSGVLVMEVVEKSPAENAGMKRNDIIVRFAGKDVPTDERRFVEVVGGAKPGETVEIVILRKGKKETLTAKLPEPPKPSQNRRAEGDRERGGKASMTMAVTINDDDFEVKAAKGDVKYQVSGRIEDGRSVPGKIVVTEGDEKNEYKSAKDVPERHQAVVRQLLGSVSGR